MTSIPGSAAWGPQDGPVKPEAPEITELKSDLDQLRAILEQAQGNDGGIDVAALEQRIEATGDPELSAQLDAIKDAFPQTVERTFTSGCSGSTTRNVSADPEQLTRNQVQQVLSDLAMAKAQLGLLDADGDGSLASAELKAGAGTMPELVEGLLDATLTGHEQELNAWGRALAGVQENLELRQSLDARLVNVAEFRAATPQGAAALTAAYRDLLTDTGRITNLESDLDGAESGPLGMRFLKWLPFFNDDGAGHLSDKEIAKFLDTADLRAFADDKNAKIEDRLGGAYSSFLAGEDLEGRHQLDDPDYTSRSHTFRSGC